MLKMKAKSKKSEFPYVKILDHNLLYSIGPRRSSPLEDPQSEIMSLLRNPLGTDPLSELITPGDKILIVADDITRPTPRKVILPPLLDELNRAGVPDEDITILIALGTHRLMNREEIRECFGSKLFKRVEIVNHRWDKPGELVNIGKTTASTPITINRKVLEADFVIGTGSVVPHCQAGWGGGAKIIQPGVCSAETTSKTHMLAAKQDDYLGLAGVVDNPVRLEIEQVAREAGLQFILNVIFNTHYQVTHVVAGDPVKAHQEGVKKARKIFVRPIKDLSGVVIVDARPADIDYWQGIKPLSYASRGVKKGGIIVLVGNFPDGVSPTHGELCVHGLRSPRELLQMEKEGEIQDGVCAASLILHALIKQKVTLICVSEGISIKDKKSLGFIHADDVESAISIALSKVGENAKIGIIHHGGDTLPKLVN